MQYTTVAIAALATAASAAPLAERQSSNAFSLISAHSGSPVHLQPIVAREQSLWVGGNTSTYCPGSVVSDCGAYKNGTVFAGFPGNPVGISMNTAVPGGQQVYIAPGGAVKYTIAHSSFQPAGSVVQGFNYVAQNGGTLGNIAPVANNSNGFLACPATAAQKETGPWQLIANVEGAQYPSGCADDCYGVDALASEATGPAAWQYA